MPAFSSTSTRTGAREFNAMHMVVAQEDLGGKIATMISAINLINTNLSLIHVALMSANASAGFSSLSGVTFTSSLPQMSNFRA